MAPDIEYVELAEDNEEFARIIKTELNETELDINNQNDWIVTVHFYSLLHYIEKRLQDHGYKSRSHADRKSNVKNCQYIDNKIRKLYRRLEDVSRDARYERIRMTDADVEMSETTLQEGKEVLGFRDGSTQHKYST